MRICVLNENKICNECGECNRCDLDKNKICDNCCKCLDADENDYANIPIADVVMNAADEFLAEYYGDEESENDLDDVESGDYQAYGLRIGRITAWVTHQ